MGCLLPESGLPPKTGLPSWTDWKFRKQHEATPFLEIRDIQLLGCRQGPNWASLDRGKSIQFRKVTVVVSSSTFAGFWVMLMMLVLCTKKSASKYSLKPPVSSSKRICLKDGAAAITSLTFSEMSETEFISTSPSFGHRCWQVYVFPACSPLTSAFCSILSAGLSKINPICQVWMSAKKIYSSVITLYLSESICQVSRLQPQWPEALHS